MTARVTAAATPLVMNDGTRLQFSPLTDRDIDEIDEWLQARVIDNAQRSLGPSLSQAERDEVLSAAARESLTISMVSPIGARMLATIAGMTRLLWQSVKRNHPEVTEDDLRRHMSNPDNIHRVNTAFAKTNTSPAQKKSAGPVNPRKGQRKKKK